MQRYRHYGASTPSATSLAAPAEEPHSTEEALNDHEQVCEEQVEPIVSEEAQDGLKKTGRTSVIVKLDFASSASHLICFC